MGYADKANEPPIELAPIVETKQPSQPATEPTLSADEEAEIAEEKRLAAERRKSEKARAEAEKRVSPPLRHDRCICLNVPLAYHVGFACTQAGSARRSNLMTMTQGMSS